MNYSEDLEVLKNSPDVILVKKTYDKEQNKDRIWKLKRLEMDGVIVEENKENTNKKVNKKLADNKEKDFEEFMEDIERDPLMRDKINLFKDENNINKLS